ncbi:MAG: isoaspartyl peptidase/L-asparaginase [Ignavibacterium sp.]|nr:isoaspartyl peptidase/L-asparaginase [Ignavibacterium sp.]
MKIAKSVLLSLFLIIYLNAQSNNNKYVIVIHGGAGYTSPDISDSLKSIYFNSLKAVLQLGKDILENGGSSLDAVEQVVRLMEDDTVFNAGKGAVFTEAGTHELDASIMSGKDLSCGAVAGVTKIKNPVSLARLVMEKTPHVLFAGTGADILGEKFNVDLVDNTYFRTEFRYQQWLKSKQKETEPKGTVGCVAMDIYGNISAATSTGGRGDKWIGRVGDTPIIGAGNYANNNTCGISATGWGELFIRHNVAFNISALMEYKGLSLQEACDEMLFKRLEEGTGGVIAVDKDGNFYMPFNTASMFRGVATSEGLFETAIWK